MPASERIEWLIGQGKQLLNSGLASTGITNWQYSLLRDQLAFRERSTKRFPNPENWLWTQRSFSQASDWWSASFKANLFPRNAVVLDGCCGAGVDTVALATRGPVTGIDQDADLVALANSNLRAHQTQLLEPLRTQAQLGTLPVDMAGHYDWLHLDPDRREACTERRLSRTIEFSPTWAQAIGMIASTQGAVLKLAPSTAIDIQDENKLQTELRCRRVWLGNVGESRQQLMLTGELCNAPLLKTICGGTLEADWRVAVLCEPNSQPIAISGTKDLPVETTLQSQRYIFDCQSVLHTADLQTTWAKSTGARALGNKQNYFTSELPVRSPWCQCFQVEEVLPWDMRRVKRWLRARKIGSVEVKKRGLRMDANQAQRELTGLGENRITLLVTPIGPKVRAIAAHRISDIESVSVT